MEVADQWQREWSGTAEYGKITEGGVTRRIARAMEVLHASAPGSRVRVLRAAYHSSAGPGVPASSYMLHSSRRVITSGFNFMDPPSLPSLPSKPLEISSTALDSSPDSHTETENYKVTEPDDLEISEPSKWRGSSGMNSIRMPSEESSSTDNASIIDLDVRANKSLHRKYSYDSESSDIQWNKKSNARSSPFLDPPVTLNTLKYKSLLNGSNEWNTRRKSYSFEDTSPCNEANSFNNDILAMESSTDSGICKSSEIVNDNADDHTHSRIFDQHDKKSKAQDETFQEWLSKNRLNSFYKGTKFKSHREHDTVIEHPAENKTDSNIVVQSAGKISITLPITIEPDDNSQQKKVKKVEFCKTELHVAVDTGEVNVISTDDKPPPSNDFRKRRSAFVPMLDIPEKSITLFGDKTIDNFESLQVGEVLKRSNGEFSDFDENTAATKSILKNKIPKPKPYLLGENMAFGSSNMSSEDTCNENSPVRTAVSLINKQLQVERRYSDEFKSSVLEHTESSIRKTNAFRTIDTGPSKDGKYDDADDVTRLVIKSENCINESVKMNNHVNTIKNKFHALQTSPTQTRSKTRQLRQSELSYFGVDNNERKNMTHFKDTDYRISSHDNVPEDIFHSVKLVKKISNSVCSSEAESEDAPKYQNVPLNTTYAPVPTPRLHSKQDVTHNRVIDNNLKSVFDKDREDIEISVPVPITRRPRLRKQEETIHTSRSLSEPPKGYQYVSHEKTHRHHNQSQRSARNTDKKEKQQSRQLIITEVSHDTNRKYDEGDIPIYVNLDGKEESAYRGFEKRSSHHRRSLRDSINKFIPKTTSRQGKSNSKNISHENDYAEIARPSDNETNSLKKKQRANNKHEAVQKIEKSEQLQHTRDSRKDAHKRLTTSQNIKRSTDSNKPNQEYMTKNKYGSRSSSSQRNTDKCKHTDVSNNLSHKGRVSSAERKTTIPKQENIVVRNGNQSNDKNILKREPLQHKQGNEPFTSPQIKTDVKHAYTNSNTKSGGHKSSRRNEYVINYDDKKGTVSSVCKIRTGSGGVRTKKISTEIIGEKPNETVVRHKGINKIALLQLADHPENENGSGYASNKWKTKIHAQRSCQLL